MAKTTPTDEELAAAAKAQADAAEAARQAEAAATGNVTPGAGPTEPSATTAATAPGVMTPGSTEPALLSVALEFGQDESATLTCLGCGASWPADRLPSGATVPCLCGRLLTVE